MIIAHTRKSDGTEQPLKLHLNETAAIASENLRPLGLPTVGYLAGILHDAGKYSEVFQTYIKEASRGEKVKRGSVNHSTNGGRMILELERNTRYEELAVELIANSIFAHHSSSGLLDFLSGENDPISPFMDRFKKEVDEYDLVQSRFQQEIMSLDELQKLLVPAGSELADLAAEHGGRIDKASQFFLLKMVYSALLDGDRRNTQRFEVDHIEDETDAKRVFSAMKDNLEETFAGFQQGKHSTINDLRQDMAEACLEAAERKTGTYKLSIPTGGGKTLSSMRFALNHALKTGKRRIIYIIPFSSIIEQNAAVFRDELKNAEYILEHHSNLVIETDDESEDSERRQALLQDNWDSPIIITTMVRFLENVFSGSTRNPRRIHQLLDSVLIFDEIQSLPPKCLSMFSKLIMFLKDYGNTTTLLCTATQPTLEKRKVALEIATDGEIVPDLEQVSAAFERVTIIDKTKRDGWKAEELTDFCEDILEKEQNLLVILNTKKAVLEVYQGLAKSDTAIKLFHLSTSMTPNHRTEVLEKIRKGLEAGERVVCVTTPLIEAGVDVSFACVVRSISGLDSIAQAAGRCNRNGESATPQPVYIVNPVKEIENIDKMAEVKTKTDITREILRDRQFTNDQSSLLAPAMIEKFFDKFYQRIESVGESEYLVNKGSMKLFDLMSNNSSRKKLYASFNGGPIPTYQVSSPATIAKHFKVISQEGESVLVEWGEGETLAADLKGDSEVIFDREWYQKAQRNSINLYQHEFQKMASENLITLSDAGVYILIKQAYDDQFGMNSAGDSQGAYLF